MACILISDTNYRQGDRDITYKHTSALPFFYVLVVFGSQQPGCHFYRKYNKKYKILYDLLLMNSAIINTCRADMDAGSHYGSVCTCECK